MPTFEEFFQAATGNEPYGYQRRLPGIDAGSAAVAQVGDLGACAPFACQSQFINIPTGLGKTAAVVLVWLWNRVARSDDAWPRRLVYCLPMRTLVEQTSEEVTKWVKKISEKPAELGLSEKASADLIWLETYSRGSSALLELKGSSAQSMPKDRNSLPKQPVVLSMSSDPKPFRHGRLHDRHGAIIVAHPSRPKATNFLEVKRRVPRVGQPELKVLRGQPANIRRQAGKPLTKTWGRRGLHRATLWADLHLFPSGARTGRRADRFARRLRFADPMPPLRARSAAATAGEPPSPEVSQWPLRFLRACSQQNHIVIRPRARNQAKNNNFFKGCPFGRGKTSLTVTIHNWRGNGVILSMDFALATSPGKMNCNLARGSGFSQKAFATNLVATLARRAGWWCGRWRG
jgi:hypothetical protein